MIAEGLDFVVGVDTHLDEHVLAIIAAPSGALVAQRSMPAGARGYAAALRFAANRGSGARVWAVEGTGSYGAGLARFLADRGEVVLEISRTPRAERRLRGKDDSLDASRIARAALASETLALPRSGERREALRLLLVARRSAVGVRREALGQLRGVIVTAPDELREQLRGLPVGRLLERCSRLRRSRAASADELATRLVLRSLARRIEAATLEAAELKRELLGHVRAGIARRAGRRADRRRATDRRLAAPRPAPVRGRLRAPRRCRPGPSLERQDNAAPTQPWRRPPAQPRPAHRRPASPPTRRGDQGLHRQTDRRRQDTPRRNPSTQALPRPPPLPRA